MKNKLNKNQTNTTSSASKNVTPKNGFEKLLYTKDGHRGDIFTAFVNISKSFDPWRFTNYIYSGIKAGTIATYKHYKSDKSFTKKFFKWLSKYDVFAKPAIWIEKMTVASFRFIAKFEFLFFLFLSIACVGVAVLLLVLSYTTNIF